MSDAEWDASVRALVKAGRHAEAAAICAERGEATRAGELYAAVWEWAKAIAVTESEGLLVEAYTHAIAGEDRPALERLLSKLEADPGLARAAAEVAETKGRTLEAAQLRDAAGETELAAKLYEAGGEHREAARRRLSLGQARDAGKLLERHLRESPDDASAWLALGRILAQFGRWEHAVRALQRAAEDAGEEAGALRLLIACFSAMGLDEAAGSRLDALRRLDAATPVTVRAFLQMEFGDERGVAAFAKRGDGEQVIGGRYRVLDTLGAGASGRVLLAHDAFHDRDVAVKVLNVGGATGRDAFVRFAREARVAAGISHANVVRIFEFNADGPFLVMEHMSGGTLADRIETEAGPVPYPAMETLHLLRSVLSALEAVHRRGVVHRDLKPPNVFFGHDGGVKLGDFGVAHLTDLGATLTGAMMGTLAYMSPEQITGSQKPEAATDLYSLGVILFRCLTGRLPFEGPDFVTQHLEEAPPRVSEVAPWLGEVFDPLLSTLLEKDPAARPASATAVLDAIRPLPWETVSTPPEQSARPAPTLGPVREVTETTRYAVRHSLSRYVSLAHDELLERPVRVLAPSPDACTRLRAFAHADHPSLQAVYDLDASQPRAIVEAPSGVLWETLAPDDPRREQAAAEVREVLSHLHERGTVHGAVDATHIVIGEFRTCLLLNLRPPDGGPEVDWSALDRLLTGGDP